MMRFVSAILRLVIGWAPSTLATVALAIAVGASAEDQVPEASAPEASASMATSAKKPGKSATLKVLVTGAGKPVGSAEITLKAASGSELKRFTNATGEANFIAPSGMARVRVIATGWASKLSEVTVADGNPKVEIVLER